MPKDKKKLNFITLNIQKIVFLTKFLISHVVSYFLNTVFTFCVLETLLNTRAPCPHSQQLRRFRVRAVRTTTVLSRIPLGNRKISQNYLSSFLSPGSQDSFYLH